MLYGAILEVNNAQQPKVLSLFSFLFIVCMAEYCECQHSFITVELMIKNVTKRLINDDRVNIKQSVYL